MDGNINLCVVRNFSDIGFTVVAEPQEWHVDFKVYEIEAEDSDFKFVLWHKKDSDHHPDPVDTLAEAEIYLHGAVKWDGCSDWYFDEQDRVMLHGCSRKDLVNLGEIMARCWDIAKKLMPNFME